MIITVDPAAEAPPYAQVRSQMLDAIATGALPAGTRLPTIRQLAGDLGLANNTVARAYRELLADGVLESRGRRGTYVRDQATDVVPDARSQRLDELARHYVDGARAIGVPSDEIIGALNRTLGA